jgi:adenylate cyclase class 2
MNSSGFAARTPHPLQRELEVKFLLPDPEAMEARLLAGAAVRLHPPQLEVNLRFDTPDRRLSREERVLRLRRDRSTRLTYKEPGPSEGALAARREVEFEVSDAEAAQEMLERLGYEGVVRYEKYREEWELGPTRIMLDRLPFGSFLEIEGPGQMEIQEAARLLGLDWDHAFQGSYLSIFAYLRQTHGLSFRDLTFENFQGLPSLDLGLPDSAKYPLIGSRDGR